MMQAHHWVVVGKTGSGKSVFARYLAMLYRAAGYRVCFIDLERKIDPALREEKASLLHPREVHDPRRLPEEHEMVFFPDIAAGPRDERLEQLYESAIHEGSLVLIHDEIVGLADQARYPSGLARIFAQGRKHRAIGVLCTQRPVCVPRVCLTQAACLAAFRVSDPSDREVVARRWYQPRILHEGWKERFGYWLLLEEQMDQAKWMPALSRDDVARAAARLAITMRKEEEKR